MTPEREQYLERCNLFERDIRRDIRGKKYLIKECKSDMNEKGYSTDAEVLERKQWIAEYKRYISMLKRQLPQRMPANKLKHCPFCGEMAVICEDECYNLVAPTLYYVSCLVCNAHTTSHLTKEEAIKAWNRRRK